MAGRAGPPGASLPHHPLTPFMPVLTQPSPEGATPSIPWSTGLWGEAPPPLPAFLDFPRNVMESIEHSRLSGFCVRSAGSRSWAPLVPGTMELEGIRAGRSLETWLLCIFSSTSWTQPLGNAASSHLPHTHFGRSSGLPCLCMSHIPARAPCAFPD